MAKFSTASVIQLLPLIAQVFTALTTSRDKIVASEAIINP
jgi:hypothetical protein